LGIRQRAHRLLGAHLDEVQIVFRTIGRNPGTMIDVGAHFGSSLAPFLAAGWTVHAFEPDPSNRAVLAAGYPSATIDSRAVSEVDGEEVSLYTSDVSTGISTLSPFHSSHTPTSAVRTVRLDSYIRDCDIKKIDFLKTDVEGTDLFALRTFPWASHHPKAVVCEFEDNKTVRLGHDVHDIANFLEERGYAVLVSEWEPITEYGGNHVWRRFARYPTEIESTSWGNLIAVDPPLLDQLEREGRITVRKLRSRQRIGRLLPIKQR
jgi:FkbM family methyltransferase